MAAQATAAETMVERGAKRARSRAGGLIQAPEPVAAPPAQDPLVPLSVRVPQSTRRRLRIAVFQIDGSVQDVVTEAVEAWLAEHAPKE